MNASTLRSLHRWFLLLCGIPLASVSANAATYTVTANRDAMLVQLDAGTNYGTVSEPLLKTNGSGGDQHRPIYGFTMPSIPAGEVITSASVRLWVTQSNGNLASIHRITDTWAEGTVTWTNTAADYNATAEATFTPTPSGAYVTVTITSLVQGWRAGTITNNGIMILGANNMDAKFTAREWSTSTQRPQLVITTAVSPVLTIAKASVLASDPFNGSINPKAIPGSVINYTITASNSANGTADNNSTIVTDTVPATMEMFVGDFGATGSGPVAFANGSPSSALTYSYISLASGADSLSFSNNGGSTYSYTPVPDGSGYDPAVTHFRVNPSGSFAPKTGATNPSFTLQVRMRVK